MRAGEVVEEGPPARRRPVPAPTIRALGALVVLAVALLLVSGTAAGPRPGRRVEPGSTTGVEVLGAHVTRPTLRSNSSSSTTTTTTPPPSLAPAALIAARASDPVPSPAPRISCADALAYLAANQAPGFVDTCADGSAQGHLGYTCADTLGRCEGERFIRIACPAPFVYMNEAHNSWVLIGARTGIDPYGQGSDAERAACDAHR